MTTSNRAPRTDMSYRAAGTRTMEQEFPTIIDLIENGCCFNEPRAIVEHEHGSPFQVIRVGRSMSE
jgi:hypothetical protein